MESKTTGFYDSRAFSSFLTQYEPMREVFKRVEKYAQKDISILIRGETGTGKDILAKISHTLSPRSSKPFAALNVSAISEGLFESELFGHKRGAFSGAFEDNQGYIEAAGEGTLFLDEFGELDSSQQTKLLRVVEQGTYRRVGETKERKVNCRLIYATHQNLEELCEKGQFREDLFYRIGVHEISIPPLRERVGDIPMLLDYFFKRFKALYGREPLSGFSLEAREILEGHYYSGNVRELIGIVDGAVLLCTGLNIEKVDLPEKVLGHLASPSTVSTRKPYPDDFLEIYESTGRNQIQTAAKMNVNRKTVGRWLKKHREMVNSEND